MSRYTADSRDRVLDAVDMLALIGARVELRRAGSTATSACARSTTSARASFHVRPDEKHFHCFGCQESGDPFDFVMQTEGLDFKAAMESLADRFGVTLETEDEDPGAPPPAGEQRERLHALLGRAATFYARYLWEARRPSPPAEYLLARGLSEETLQEFQVGYAPSAWDRMLEGITRAQASATRNCWPPGSSSAPRTGPARSMTASASGSCFRPPTPAAGCAGFGARAMREDQQPKYLNTSDGRALPQARGAVRHRPRPGGGRARRAG